MKLLFFIVFIISSLYSIEFRDIKKFDHKCKVESYKIACNAIAHSYYNGINSFPKDIEKATEYYDLACKKRHYNSCVSLGNIIFNDKKNDKKIAQNHKIAFNYYKSSCDNDNEKGCYNLAKMYYKGLFVEKNEEKTKSLLEKACENEHEKACKMIEEKSFLFN